MSKSIWKSLSEEWSTLVAALSIFAIFLTMFLYFVDRNASVPAAWLFFAVGFLTCMLIWLAAGLGWAINHRPKAIAKVRAYSAYLFDSSDSVDVLILESTEIFGVGVECSVYFSEDELERLIGVGRILTIQQNGNVQVAVEKRIGGSDDIWSRLIRNERDALRLCFARPGRIRDGMETR